MRRKVQIGVKFDPDLLERLDAYGDSLPVPVTRTALLETAVRQMLEREQKAKRRRQEAATALA